MSESSPPPDPLRDRLDRRELLARAAMGAGAISLVALAGCMDAERRKRLAIARPGESHRVLTDAEWATLSAAQARLLPSEPGSPGATDVNAIGFLDALLADPDTDPDEVVRIKEGAARLDRIARRMKAASFAELAPARQDAALSMFHSVEDGPGWFTAMIWFVLQAFFGDPVYGGNPGGIGWAWAGHVPGAPRPKKPFRAEPR